MPIAPRSYGHRHGTWVFETAGKSQASRTLGEAGFFYFFIFFYSAWTRTPICMLDAVHCHVSTSRGSDRRRSFLRTTFLEQTVHSRLSTTSRWSDRRRSFLRTTFLEQTVHS